MPAHHRIPLAALLCATTLVLAVSLASTEPVQSSVTVTAGASAPPPPHTATAPPTSRATSTTTTTTTAAPPTTTTTPPTTVAPTTTTVAPATTSPPAAPPTTAPAPAPAPTEIASPAPTPTPPPPPPAAARTGPCEANVSAWMNDARARAGVAPLTDDAGMSQIPLDWSRHMAASNTLAHNPDYGRQVRSVRPARAIAENVGYASDGERVVFDRFMSSPGHRANILDATYSHAATGCAVDGRGWVWITVDFWG